MDESEAAQWFFDLQKITEGFNWPINASGLASAKRSLDGAISKKASASDVLDIYKRFAGAVGPSVMNALLESDDAFPEVNHSGKPTPPSPGKVTLYVDPQGQRVLASVTKEWGMPAKFYLE